MDDDSRTNAKNGGSSLSDYGRALLTQKGGWTLGELYPYDRDLATRICRESVPPKAKAKKAKE